jgi:hypothetical protein
MLAWVLGGRTCEVKVRLRVEELLTALLQLPGKKRMESPELRPVTMMLCGPEL